MKLPPHQLEILRQLAGAHEMARPANWRGPPIWRGMTMRALRRRGLIEEGSRWTTTSWWGAGPGRVEERHHCRTFYRITPLGRAVLKEHG